MENFVACCCFSPSSLTGLSYWKVGVYNRTSSETAGLANLFIAFSTRWWADKVFCLYSAFSIAFDRAGSTSFVFCPQPRHGLVPGILGMGEKHFGPEQSHSVYNPWIAIRFRKLQFQTSSWNLHYFGFSTRSSRARQRRSGLFWFFQRTSVDGWCLVHPQSGDCRNSGPSKTVTAVDVAQCIFAKLETPNTCGLLGSTRIWMNFSSSSTLAGQNWQQSLLTKVPHCPTQPLAESLLLCTEA